MKNGKYAVFANIFADVQWDKDASKILQTTPSQYTILAVLTTKYTRKVVQEHNLACFNNDLKQVQLILCNLTVHHQKKIHQQHFLHQYQNLRN